MSNRKYTRDKHEKKRAGGEKAKSNKDWVDGGKHTNSDRNKSRKGGGGGKGLISTIIDSIFGK